MSTRWLGLKVSALVSVVSLISPGLAGEALAQSVPARIGLATRPSRAEVAPDDWPAWVHAIFVGVSGGYGYAIIKHPDVAPTSPRPRCPGRCSPSRPATRSTRG